MVTRTSPPSSPLASPVPHASSSYLPPPSVTQEELFVLASSLFPEEVISTSSSLLDPALQDRCFNAITTAFNQHDYTILANHSDTVLKIKNTYGKTIDEWLNEPNHQSHAEHFPHNISNPSDHKGVISAVAQTSLQNQSYLNLLLDGPILSSSNDYKGAVVIDSQSPSDLSNKDLASSLNQESPPSSQRFFLGGARETRSNFIATGPMQVLNFDETTGMLEMAFTSCQQDERFHQQMASVAAAYGNYALAKRFSDQADIAHNIPSLEWMGQALKATAHQIRKEDNKDKEWTAVIYESHHAPRVAESLKNKKSIYEMLIEKMSTAFREKDFDLEILDENFQRARALRPNVFEPYYFAIPISALSDSLLFSVLGDNKEPHEFVFADFVSPASAFSGELIQEASINFPLQTFNFLMVLLSGVSSSLQDKESSISLLAYTQSILKNFPDDVLVYMAINGLGIPSTALHDDPAAKENELRTAFSTALAQGLRAIRRRDFETAREEFSKAEKYCISDKRSYIYRALIDLKAGDFLSATRLTISLGRLVDWYAPLKRLQFIDSTIKFLNRTQPLCIEPDMHPESRVLKALIKLCSAKNRDDKINQTFFNALEEYLTHPEVDLMWACLALDIAKELFGEISEYWHHPSVMKPVMNLSVALISIPFTYLARSGEDLSSYKHLITPTEAEGLSLAITLTLTSPRTEGSAISINPDSFQMPRESRISLLHEILWERYNDFCLSFIRVGMNVAKLMQLLENTLDSPLYEPFVATLLERFDKEGILEQRTAFVKWATTHIAFWPASQCQTLANCIFRWQLDQPLPCQGVEPLAKVSKEWLDRVESRITLEMSDLRIAFQAWNFLQQRDFSSAQAEIIPFFDDLPSQMKGGIDFVALRILCLVRALLSRAEIARALPSSFATPHHAQLIVSALSIIAREGLAGLPYIAPDIDLSEHRARELYYLYIGQQQGESDEEYAKRLQKALIPNLSDLRLARRCTLDGTGTEALPSGWITPFIRPKAIAQANRCIENEITIHKARCTKNGVIAEERPEYTADPEFIQWVKGYPDLIGNFIKDPDKVKNDFNQAFPGFSKPAKDRFFGELNKKSEKEKEFIDLRNKTERSFEDRGKRFWQLVEQTVSLIGNIYSGSRDEEDYDMVVQDEPEARFVMQLIYEWSRASWSKNQVLSEEFAHAFHGPETHVWGCGPRIPHFNAGVYKNETLVNVHIFYGRGKLDKKRSVKPDFKSS